MKPPPPLEPSCLRYLQPGARVVVALSGGRDSVALLRLLLMREGLSVYACHVHHGIRGKEADDDAAFCRALCRTLHVPLHIAAVDVPTLAKERKQSLEATARTERRRLLAECARQAGTPLIALAHHAEDQVETILLQLARGSAGLRGMRPVHRTGDIIWLRPLLHLRRQELTHWLHTQSQPWREDSTNACPDVSRNALRLEVIPALQHAMKRDVVPILTRSARLHRETLEALETALEALPLCDPQGRLYLPFLQDKDLPFRKAVLHRYLHQAGVPDVSEAMALAIDAILPPDAPASRLALPGGWRACRKARRLILLPPRSEGPRQYL